MTDYEVLIAIAEGISEDDQKKLIKDITDTIEKLDGKVGKIDDWGKKALAFSIGKNKNTYYTLISFQGGPALPKNLTDKLRINESLLRYLITKQEKTAVKVSA